MKALGEVDYEKQGKLLIRSTKWAEEADLFWVDVQKVVRDRKGKYVTHGRGVAITATRNGTVHVGDVVEFSHGGVKVRPLFTRKVRKRNVKPKLAQNMCASLADMMTWNPMRQ